MKLAVTQIALGIILIICACIVINRMFPIRNALVFAGTWNESDKQLVGQFIIYDNPFQFFTSLASSVLLLVAAIGISAISLVFLFNPAISGYKLQILQIALGTIAAAAAFFIFEFGYAEYNTMRWTEDSRGITIRVINAYPFFTMGAFRPFLGLLASLGIVGTGTTRLLMARNK